MVDYYRKYNFKMPFEVDGFWWSMDGRIEKTPGRLSYVPGDAARLTLLGTFDLKLDDDLDELGAFFGEISSGDLVTLLDPLNIGHTLNLNAAGLTDLKFMANIAFAGNFHVSKSEVFHSAQIGLSALEPWIDRRPYDHFSPTKDSDGNLRTSITHLCAPRKTFNVSEIGASISFFNGFNSSTSDASTRSIKNEESIIITPRKKQETTWFMGKAHSVNILISSLSATPGTVEYIYLRQKRSRAERSRIHDPFVSMFGSSATAVNTKPYSAHDVIIPYRVVSHRMKNILNGWFKRTETSKTASTMLHSIRLRKPTIDVGLLIRVQAFEAWMQGRSNNRYISERAFGKIRRKLLEAAEVEIPDNKDLVHSLRISLKHGNEKSLGEKLTDVLDNTDAEVTAHLLFMSVENFVSQVVSTRNHMAHRPKNASKNVRISGKPLYDLCNSLEWFLWYLVISDIGIPKLVLRERILKHHEISAYRRGRKKPD